MDYITRRNLALNIIQYFLRPDARESLDSLEKMQIIIKLIKPLLADAEDAVEEDTYSFENSQSQVCKMIYIVKTEDPEMAYQIYNQLKNIFIDGGVKRRKITLPALANYLILFCHRLSIAFDNKNELVSEEMKKNPYVSQSIEAFNINKFENNEAFYKLMIDIYKLLNELITLIAEINPETAFKLYLVSASQVNSILSDRKNLEEACVSFINSALQLYQDQNFEENIKYNMFLEICGYLINMPILSKENLENFVKILMESGTKMVRRANQFNSMINIGQIYYTVFKDGNIVSECLKKAKKYADFSMTNPKNLVLYLDLLNKYLYFIDSEEEIVTIKAEQIEEIIELIQNHIITIKNEVTGDLNFLPSLELYFQNTIQLIQKRKSEENHKPIYDEILKELKVEE